MTSVLIGVVIGAVFVIAVMAYGVYEFFTRARNGG